MVPVHTREVDGTQALDAQERALQYMEEADFGKVVSYSQNPGAGANANEASLQNVPIGSQPPPLSLIALDVGADPAATIAKQEKGGKILAFQGEAFVSSKPQFVLGFRAQV